MGEKGKLFYNSRIPINNCRRNDGDRKWLFAKYHINNFHRHESDWMLNQWWKSDDK